MRPSPYEPAVAATDDTFRRHAADLYRKCLDEELITSPIKRALAQKRLEQVAASTVNAVVVPENASSVSPDKLYMVINLSSGPKSKKYKVSYLQAEPKGGWTNKHKTDWLVLRRIEPGSFIMGKDQKDESHRVTLTKPYYIGVFEVTQKQWELVMGDQPAFWRDAGIVCDARPVESVAFDRIRGKVKGSAWPASASVDGDSFIGRLRDRLDLTFDLPTEAQWEYAARAGEAQPYGGADSCGEFGRYRGNGGWQAEWGKHWERHLLRRHRADGGTAIVGSYKPNAWGLFDFCGNVWEFCLDWEGGLSYGTDPVGAGSGSKRVDRGESCLGSGLFVARGSFVPSDGGYTCLGFRLALPLEK